jgi:uncharacterized membrane protein HdeD (DUF308 family)
MASDSVTTFVNKSVGWSIALSVLLIVAGIAAIANPMAAGLAVKTLVGWLLIFSGIMHLAFAWNQRGAGGFLWELLIGVLYVVVGVYLLRNPVAGLQSLTIALGIYLFLEGVLDLVMGFTLRGVSGSGWLLFDGIVTLFLALLIWRNIPSSSSWVIGTLVGVSMLFSGVTRLALSLGARKVVNTTLGDRGKTAA